MLLNYKHNTKPYSDTSFTAVCIFPPELDFAVVEEEYIHQEFFNSGKTVQYKCRPGFVPVTGKNNTLTCLTDLKWSQHELFCTRKFILSSHLHFAMCYLYNKLKHGCNFLSRSLHDWVTVAKPRTYDYRWANFSRVREKNLVQIVLVQSKPYVHQ